MASCLHGEGSGGARIDVAVGNGMKIKVYSDAWITDIPLEREVWRMVCPPLGEEPRVAQFIKETKEWDVAKLQE